MFSKLIQEPLVQFFISGCVLYGLYTQVISENTQNTEGVGLKKKIVLTKNVNAPLALQKYKAVLLEEAYFLQLYKQDKEISDILLGKMESIINAQAKVEEPTEKELKQFYLQHKNEYTQATQFTFYVYTLPTTVSSLEYKKIKARLNLLGFIPHDAKMFSDISKGELDNRFGKFFSHKVSLLSSGIWSGVILFKNAPSLVLVKRKEGESVFSFDDVELRVYQDYITQKQLQKKRQLLKTMMQHYEIEVQ
jgi:hypothetical protein